MEAAIEQLRQDMIVAFRVFAEKPFGERRDDWDFYCKCRENYLKESAKIYGYEYVPLKYTMNLLGH
jgi:hypothetical protein